MSPCQGLVESSILSGRTDGRPRNASFEAVAVCSESERIENRSRYTRRAERGLVGEVGSRKISEEIYS